MANPMCSDLYKEATKGRHWKTVGDDVQYDIVSEDYYNGNKKAIAVFYQCSTSKRDWINSFNFMPKRVKFIPAIGSRKKCYIWVHRGFWKAFVSAWPVVYQAILSEMKGYEDKHVSLVFAGHSFGGAMSVLSAITWTRLNLAKQIKNMNKEISKGFTELTLLTWGAPKVLFDKRSRINLHWSSNTYQWACHNDLVARMPPFYPRYKDTKFVGDKFNLFKMLSKMEHYHTCYDEVEE